MATLKQLLASHLRAKAKYDSAIAKIHGFIQERCDFEIYITDMAGDGLAVMSVAEASGISVDDAMVLLKSSNRITEDNFKSYL